MPIISTDHDYLTVINLFGTDTAGKQDRLLGAMREIVDTAAFPGWISSTVHSGQEKHGTANFIQWRSGEDLEERYRGEEFRHHTLPLFSELTTFLMLLQTKVAYTLQHRSQGGRTDITPKRDDYTVIEVLGVAPEDQKELIATLEQSQEWLPDTPGFRSYNVLRGLRARGVGHGAHVTLTEAGPADDGFVVTYSQWADQESYDAFRALPAGEYPPARQQQQGRLDTLLTSNASNTYRVVHSRSAGQ
jgi:heme-degrading monooxygenase HmoA